MTTLIIGGGLAGLALAEMLQSQGREFMLLEARDRFGGRIKTEYHGDGYFDLGPAWFWPEQPRIAKLTDRLKLEKFDQYDQGALSFEDENGGVQRGRGFASMQGSWRLKGGLAALTDALANALPDARKRLNAMVVALDRTNDGLIATLENGDRLTADRVVIALPPRLAANIKFTPDLPPATIESMKGIATWMAGQAKAIAIYDTPFWRDEGLSGDAQSRHGPMVEVHDASPMDGGPYALFGFIGVPPQGRANEQLLRTHLLAQLGRLFGAKAAKPRKLVIKDWAFDPYTATQADQAPLYAHPTYGLQKSMTGLWENRLLFGGTEVALRFGGYIEGALEAAENVLPHLSDSE
ncbi:NAD(P)/FAD-dependent oxidoreductase [uncultured Litoreibacter sp.]|uniref:flavin monoamine oxidase family protein n=1 Tax=uncultured Litoreibacter sp. TaxID=1392394 RepID=UPI002638E25C|nr:NAD(P)/FAD-dependent oxidoreductase [uncultured Litoreibacter sp.]